MNKLKAANQNQDLFSNRLGFILACVGSAVGMGNIWLFPARVSAYGGATFLIPYLIFVLLIGSTGVIGEMSLGRAAGSGPIGAFGLATGQRFGKRKVGETFGIIPVVGALALGIGYSVVMGWILKYMIGSFSGTISAVENLDGYINLFNSTASSWGNTAWQLLALIITLCVMYLGVNKGIEKVNKVLLPLFFLLFIALAVYVALQPGAMEGYRYIFLLDPKGLADPMVWIYALGQAFFSLSIAGNGTVIYGSYLSKKENIPSSAFFIALFDTMAAILAALVIIPAMATAGQQVSDGGPGLMFIFLPNIFKTMPGGQIVMCVFFVAVFFAGITSIINMLEVPIATLQQLFKIKRVWSVAIIGAVAISVSLCIQGIVSNWMDFCSIYICPLGALLAGVMFFWICKKDFMLSEVNRGRLHPIGGWFQPLAKYVFCGVCLAVLILGATIGSIG